MQKGTFLKPTTLERAELRQRVKRVESCRETNSRQASEANISRKAPLYPNRKRRPVAGRQRVVQLPELVRRLRETNIFGSQGRNSRRRWRCIPGLPGKSRLRLRL